MSESKIHLLPQHLINQIAAGEVVERPASVVKELVENSIDAGAKTIRIEIENGGLNLIKVVDDGCGMSREDAEKSILQHATSKISADIDLENINTLGFRGEALASISSVSQFSLITKDDDSLAGTLVEMTDAGLRMSDSSAARGTVIAVRNLFHNVPARRKYLKTAVTEFNHIVDLFFEFCLAYPNIFWKLTHNNKTIYQFPGTTLLQRVGDVLGDEITKNLIEIDVKINDIHVHGYVGKPQVARNNRKLQYLYINSRPVHEFIVAKQIKDAFGTLLPRDLYPVYILSLDVAPGVVDVNVHPRKLEVRFSDPQLIYRTVYQVVSRTLDDNNLTMKVSATHKLFTPIADVLQNKKQEIKLDFPHREQSNFDYKPKNQAGPQKIATFSFERFGAKNSDVPSGVVPVESLVEKDFEVMGQVENSYIVVKTRTSIKIYDQHASSERVQYEKIKKEWSEGVIPTQPLLLPVKLELPPMESHLAKEKLSFFEKIGFDIALFGANTFVISAVPQLLRFLEVKPLFLEILATLDSDHTVLEVDSLEKIYKIMACRSAIKFGDPLSLGGMEALISDLEALDNKYTCVHGRPCVLEFTFSELETLFKRK